MKTILPSVKVVSFNTDRSSELERFVFEAQEVESKERFEECFGTEILTSLHSFSGGIRASGGSRKLF